MPLRDLRGFIETAHHQLHKTTDRFLGFRKRTIDHPRAAGARNDTRLEFQWLALDRLALGEQAIEPGIPARHELLTLIGRQVLVGFRSGVAKQQ